MSRKIIVASHGGLAKGIVDSASMIIGIPSYPIEVYTLCPGEVADDFAKEIEKEIQANLDVQYIVLTDLFGASVFNAMYSLLKFENVKLCTGINLNLLLQICMESKDWLTDQDMSRIVSESKEGIQFIENIVIEQEDF